MGSSAGETIKQGLCFPILKAVDAAKEGNGFDAASYIACPIGVGSAARGIKAAADGDTKKALQEATGFFLPNVDPISTAVQKGAQYGVGELYDKLTDTSDTGELQTDTAKPQTTDEAYAELQKVYEDARNNTAAQEDLARRSAMKAALNQGVSGAKASALAGSKTPIGNAAQNLSTARNNWIAQKNAELERKAQADALAREAKNLDEAKGRATAAAALGGGAAGASGALSIFGGSLGGGN